MNTFGRWMLKRQVQQIVTVDKDAHNQIGFAEGAVDLTQDGYQSTVDFGKNSWQSIAKKVASLSECHHQRCRSKKIKKSNYCLIHTCRQTDCFEPRTKIADGYCQKHVRSQW